MTLDDERNFTRAAARCHVTQQSLSAAIARLERAVGTPLVQRTTRSVAITPAGEAFALRARRALAEAAAALDDARAVGSGRTARLVVGFHGPGADLAAPLLDEHARRWPDISIELRRAEFTDPAAGVLDGSSDLALVAAPLRHRGLRSTAVVTEPMVIAVADDHPLAGQPDLRPEDLSRYPVAEMPNPEGGPLLRQWNAFWTLRALPAPPPTVIVGFNGVEEWLARQRRAPWFSTGPASAARLYPAAGITWRPCPGLPPCTWRLYSRTGDARPAIRRTLNLVAQWRRGQLTTGSAAQPVRSIEARRSR